jgi:DNA repair protein RadA/Sms
MEQRAEALLRDTARLVEYDAYDLQQLPPVELRYLPLLAKEGYVVEGWSHLWAGYPRVGKTELLYATVQEWLLLRLLTLYFTEEALTLWQQRLLERSVAGKGLRLVFALGESPGTMLNRMISGQEQIVIVDTIRNLGIIGPDENDNARIAAALRPWVAAAREKGKTLIFVHHSKKSGGEHGKGISGGHALLGTVDIALEIDFDQSPERRVIKPHARVISPCELLYERLPDGRFQPLGDPETIGIDEIRHRLFNVADQEWAETKQLIDRLEDPKPSLEQARRALTAEARCGRLQRDPPIAVESVQGKRVRWRKPAGE